jgi:DNA-binding HxlR family transcriptional regulator
MPLPNDYAAQNCAAARALEIVGERWTLLIVRDAFYGVRRFGDFVAHLDIPRAVLTERLKALVVEDVLERVPGRGAREDYALTEKGLRLWPIVRGLMDWGTEFYSDGSNARAFRHTADGALIAADGHCTQCGAHVAVADILMEPRAGYQVVREDPVSAVLGQPRRLLEPLYPEQLLAQT